MTASARPRKRAGILGYLTAFFATSHVDRHIIAIALPAIGVEFALNDMQLGVLSGVAFSLVFALAATPLGMATAFIDRRHVIAMSIFLWSAMTAVSAFASGFWFLLLTRLGVGVAEAAGVPAAHRALSESHDEKDRVRAFSIFNAGAGVGIALALVGGGVLVQAYGWRVAMLAAGAPGLALAGLAYRWIPVAPPGKAPGEGGSASLLRVAKSAIIDTPFKRLTFLGVVLTSIISFGMLAWLPSFLVRAHGMPTQQVGLYIAVVLGLLGMVGTILGGRLVSSAAKADPARTIWLPMLLLLIGKPLVLVAMLTESRPVALAALVFPLMFGALHFVTSLAVLHERLDGRTSQLVSAFLLTGGNLVGYALGPLIVGAASWAMSGVIPGDERLGYAIIILQGLSVFGLYAYWRAGFAYRAAREAQGVASSSGAAGRHPASI